MAQTQTPLHAVGLSAVDPALPAPAGRVAEQPVPGGGISQAFAVRAAEQLVGGGSTNVGCVAAEQPTPGGLQAGGTLTSDLDAEEAQLRRDIAALERQRAEEQFWKQRQQQRTDAQLR